MVTSTQKGNGGGSANISGGINDGNGNGDSSESGGLNTGAKAGIGVGVAVGVLALLGIGVLLFLRHGRRQRAAGYGEKPGDGRPGPFTDHKAGDGVGALPGFGRGTNGTNGANGLGTVSAAEFQYDERTGGYVPGPQASQVAADGVLGYHPPPGESFGAVPTTAGSGTSSGIREENYLRAGGIGAINDGGGAPIQEKYSETQRAAMEGQGTRPISGVYELP